MYQNPYNLFSMPINMKTILVEKLPRIIKAKKRLEEKLKVKISNRGKEVTIQGKPENEYTAEKVIDAINLGFSIPTALLIKTEHDYTFEIINIKDHTRRKDMELVRGRIIGKDGSTLKTMSDLSQCYFEINENKVGIIGDVEFIKRAQEALIMLIKGAKQGNIYGFLERNRYEPVEDLGLKEDDKK